MELGGSLGFEVLFGVRAATAVVPAETGDFLMSIYASQINGTGNLNK